MSVDEPGHRIKDLQDLGIVLSEMGIECWPIPDRDQLVIACGVSNDPAQLRVSFDGQLMHFELFLGIFAARSALTMAASTICRINRGLRIPGFVIDQESGAVSFRI